MTEMVNGDVPVQPSPTPSQPAPVESERTFKQSEVNDLVGRAKSEAVERYKRETSMASHSQQQSYVPQQNQQGHVQSAPQHHISLDDVRRTAAEEAERSRNEWIQEQQRTAHEQDAQRIASEFFTKVGTGQEGGADGFRKFAADSGVDLGSIPYHVQLSNMVDNTREVMTELISNPSKIGAIQNLIDIDLRAGRNPTLALAEIKRLSQSIKDNQKGRRYQPPNEPLSQLKPSNTGTDKMGDRSASDYRRDPKYRV
jgi:hypothetical protein